MYIEDLALNNLLLWIYHKTQPNHIIYFINIQKQDLALNNQQWLICHITRPNQGHRHEVNESMDSYQ